MTCRFAPTVVRKGYTLVENGFIAEYLPNASKLELEVYLYGLMQCNHPGIDGSIADALGLTEQEVVSAFCYWQTLKLVRIQSDKPLIVEYLPLPNEGDAEYSPAKYSGLVAKLNTLTAPRQFNARELAHVYDWVEVYGLDEGAVLELVSHCMETKSRRISINYISSVAQAWAENGIKSFEDARREIERYDLSKHGAAAILRRWNKRRKPTKDEMALYEKWTGEWGFTGEAIMTALPRLAASANPNFIYLDELLDQLRGRNITDAADIAEEDEHNAQERAFAKLLFDRMGRAEHATSTQRAQISMYLEQYKLPREMLLYAAECSRDSSEPFGNMKKLLNEWHEAGLKTVADAEQYWKTHQEKTWKKDGSRGRNTEYAQRKVTDEQFADLFLDLNQDLTEGGNESAD